MNEFHFNQLNIFVQYQLVYFWALVPTKTLLFVGKDSQVGMHPTTFCSQPAVLVIMSLIKISLMFIMSPT